MQKKVQEILSKLAKKYDLPVHVIEEVYNSQFGIIKENIKGFTFKTIKLPNLGKFAASKNKVSKIKKYQDAINGREQNTQDSKDNAVQGSGKDC